MTDFYWAPGFWTDIHPRPKMYQLAVTVNAETGLAVATDPETGEQIHFAVMRKARCPLQLVTKDVFDDLVEAGRK